MSQVIRFEKVVPEGKAMGHLKDGRAVFTIGPIPDEVAEIGIRKQKKTYADAVLRKIVEPSPKRSEEVEDHSLSCSPWQGVDYAYQLELKKAMLIESFGQQHLELTHPEMIGSKQQFGYRNRLDFTVAEIEGELQLAFHQRGSWDTLIPLPKGCVLGNEAINTAALNLLEQLKSLPVSIAPATITVRYAPTTKQMLTILTTPAKADWKRIETDQLGNFVVCRPLPGSGAPGMAVYNDGDTYITETLAGSVITYPYNAFFQTNTPAFEVALQQIIAAAKDSQKIIELYSGVGAIGIPLAAHGIPTHGIEIVPEAVEFAERNARTNNIVAYQAEVVAAERMDATVLKGADTIILDPPRAGLHPRVTSWLLDAAPEQIIYLSCNPVTQARDIAKLTDYELVSVTGYDFYPGALHLESLAILKRRK